MAKRFTDTEKYKKPFVRGLKGPYKLLWDYLYHDCDNAGIWIVDFEIAQIYLGADMKVNEQDALRFFNADQYRVHPFDGGKKWFIPSFISFQYNELSETNPAHKKIFSTLSSLNFLDQNGGPSKDLQRASQGACIAPMDMDMDKELDKVKEPKIQKQKSEPMNPEEVSATIPASWNKAEFETLLLKWAAKRKKKPDTELAILRVSELIERRPNWIDAKKNMIEAAAEGWMKLVYTDKETATQPEGGRYANERGLKFDKA